MWYFQAMTLPHPASLVRKFAGIADLPLRRQAVARSLDSLEASVVVPFVNHLIDNLRTSDVARFLYLDVVLHLVSAPTSRKREIYLKASTTKNAPLFLFVSGLSDTGINSPPAVEREEPYAYEDVPLGVRKSMARSHDRDTLWLIAEDPHPDVVAIFLENPHVTGEMVLKVASLRPQTPATFMVILRSPRFGVRPQVQAAIAMNPFCPAPLRAALLPLLNRRDLESIADSPSVDFRLRAAASFVLSNLL